MKEFERIFLLPENQHLIWDSLIFSCQRANDRPAPLARPPDAQAAAPRDAALPAAARPERTAASDVTLKVGRCRYLLNPNEARAERRSPRLCIIVTLASSPPRLRRWL
jgi:hypothetical protein